MGHLVIRVEEFRPLIEGYINRCGREDLSDACLRRVYDILHDKTEYMTHKVADKICTEIDHPEYLQLVEVFEVDLAKGSLICAVPDATRPCGAFRTP